jgi:cytochrome c oxidase subunit II
MASGAKFLSPAMESESAKKMKLVQHARAAGLAFKVMCLSLALLSAPQLAAAPASPAAAPIAAVPASEPAVEAVSAADAARLAVAPGGYTPMKPTPGKGMPVDGRMGFQDQYSPIGEYGLWMHQAVLLPLISVISLFVLGLLLWVVARYRKAANPVPSKTSHNALMEVVWILIPTLILAAVAIPSIDLLQKQFKPAPEKALTIKATGNQWFWSYSYPDNGGFEVISNMLPPEEAAKRGEPGQLAADYRMVVPAQEEIRVQVTGADVIHSFAIPSLWFKIDAVPGRINEMVMFVKEPGVYYGQCSELCGSRHGYMPIVIEALPRDKYNAWVLTQSGGVIDGMPKPAEPIAPAPAPAASVSPAPVA